MKDQTLAIHAGFKSDSATKSVAVPVYQTVAYEFDNAQHGADLFNLAVPGNIYTRIMNPTVDVLEQRCAELEGGIAGLCLSAGSAAINYAILTLAEKGNNIVTVPLLYGGTYTLFKHMLPKLGIEVRFSNDDSVASMEGLINENTTAIFCESIGNPAGNVVDIEALANMAHAHGVPLVVDNTVATSALIKPIEWGADIIANSLTKYMAGHGNSLGGVIVDSGEFPCVSRCGVHRGARRRGLHWPRQNSALAQYRLGAEPDECLSDTAGSADAAAPHGTSLRKRNCSRELPQGGSAC
jgi:O-acetylhomoserine (thiol)-lyase